MSKEIDEMKAILEGARQTVLAEAAAFGVDLEAEKEARDEARKIKDPLAADPRTTEDASGLASWTRDYCHDLESRIIARDNQAAAMAFLEDLKLSAADVHAANMVKARAKDNAAREAEVNPPIDAESGRALLGTLLLKCETAASEVLDQGISSDAKTQALRLTQGARLTRAAAHIVRVLGELDRWRVKAKPARDKAT